MTMEEGERLGLGLQQRLAAGGALATPNRTQYDTPSKTEPNDAGAVGIAGTTTTVSTKTTATKAPVAPTATSGTLSFTDLNLLRVGVVSGGLGGGFVLRGAGRKRDETS